jgi:cytidine deaminase
MTDLLSLARAAQRNAHAPYSGFHIGAAIRLENGQTFAGCNVENASYGATICAERAAILGAVAAIGTLRVVEVVVASEGSPPWPPCGMCRQVMAEFCAPDCLVHAVNSEGTTLSWRFDELFPCGFTPHFLGEPDLQPAPAPPDPV